uniref:Uncharacterized protein n=1 Tax=Arundo donax TaxID=35708 RepID=A0A0A9AIK7_ARUDO
MQRQVMMPGAAGLNYSSAFLEARRRESVGAIGLSYSSAFLEDRRREFVQKQEQLRMMIAYGCQ